MISHKVKSRIAIGICGILLVAAGILGFTLWSMEQAGNPSPGGEAREVSLDPYGFPEVDWDYWKSVNPDVIGWVTVPGTNIDSPIVQAHSSDPEYYLHHDVYGKYNVYGCPYLDAGCETEGFKSYNSVIFGHHMNDQTVFSAFSKYTDAAFAKENGKVLLQTPDEKHVLSVKLAEMINAGTDRSKRTSFVDTADFGRWYAERAQSADVVIDSSVPVRNYTFVTCSYNRWKNERTLVFASE